MAHLYVHELCPKSCLRCGNSALSREEVLAGKLSVEILAGTSLGGNGTGGGVGSKGSTEMERCGVGGADHLSDECKGG